MLKPEIEITYAQWKTVTTLGSKSLGHVLAKAALPKLRELEYKLREWDPQTTKYVFYILDVPLEDGTEYRMPDEVQRLYGKRYLMALNLIKEALQHELADRAFREMFDAVNA